MSKFRQFATGDKLAPSASQVNAWTDAALANIGPRPPGGNEYKSPFRVVKLKSIIAVGKFGECVVMVGPKGAEVESDNTVRCYNRFASLAADTIAIAAYVVNGWELVAAMCPADESEEG